MLLLPSSPTMRTRSSRSVLTFVSRSLVREPRSERCTPLRVLRRISSGEWWNLLSRISSRRHGKFGVYLANNFYQMSTRLIIYQLDRKLGLQLVFAVTSQTSFGWEPRKSTPMTAVTKSAFGLDRSHSKCQNRGFRLYPSTNRLQKSLNFEIMQHRKITDRPKKFT